MNALVNFNSQLTMSSREIAELTGKQHKDVLSDCRKMFDALNLRSADFSADYKDAMNRTQSEYLLNQDLTMTLVMGYSTELRYKVSVRWRELEGSAKPAIPQTYAAALLEAGRLALENENQAEQLRLAAPKVEFVNKFIQADSGNMTFRATAKILKINEREFRTFLRDSKIMYLLGGDWVPYQQHIEAGRFEIKAGLIEHEDNSHAFKQSKFTPKGIEWVAGEYAKHQAPKALQEAEIA